MALTREFKDTVVARARRDAKFRDAMFAEAINAYLAGDTQTGKAMLRDLVNATIGFEGLSAEIRKPSKSLHRMLATRGNPSTENFFGIVKALQKKTRTRLRVAVQSSEGGWGWQIGGFARNCSRRRAVCTRWARSTSRSCGNSRPSGWCKRLRRLCRLPHLFRPTVSFQLCCSREKASSGLGRTRRTAHAI